MPEEKPKRGRPPIPADPKTRGGRVRIVREKQGLSTTEVANLIGCSDDAISWGERNKGEGFSNQLLFAIAHVLGSDFDDPDVREHLPRWLERIQEVWNLKPGEHIQSAAPVHISKSRKRQKEAAPLKELPAELVVTHPDEIELMTFYRTLTPEQQGFLKQAIGMLREDPAVLLRLVS